MFEHLASLCRSIVWRCALAAAIGPLLVISARAAPAEVIFRGSVIFTGSSHLIMELAGTAPGSEYDTITAAGTVGLGGTLDVDLLGGFVPDPGDTFQIISATGGISGTFANVLFPALADAKWQLRYTPNSVLLQVALRGDYNADGTVDAADYVHWRKTFGANGFGLAADGNGNNQIDADDYDVWQAHFGDAFGGGSGANSPGDAGAAVPEPNSLILLGFAMKWLTLLFRRRLY